MPRNDQNTPPGQPPEPNPGQPDTSTQYTALDSGQDVRRTGYYFSAQNQVVRYFRDGDSLPGDNETWYFVTEDRTLSPATAAEHVAQYGFDVDPAELSVEYE